MTLPPSSWLTYAIFVLSRLGYRIANQEDGDCDANGPWAQFRNEGFTMLMTKATSACVTEVWDATEDGQGACVKGDIDSTNRLMSMPHTSKKNSKQGL